MRITDQATKLSSILGYSSHTRVDALGFSGGIWVYWKVESVNVHPINHHGQYINMEISRVGEEPWYFTAVYASLDPTKRQELWKELEDFTTKHNKQWLIVGEFNDTRFSWERSSVSESSSRRSARFNDWINNMHLLEVEFSSPAHTWARGNSPETRRSARLDRAFYNGDWSLRFENARVRHLPAVQSDHCPILISPNGFAPLEAINRPFRFQVAWLTHECFQDFVLEN